MIRIVKLGAAQRRGEGLRSGIVRSVHSPALVVPKADIAGLNHYDVRFANVSPRKELLDDFRHKRCTRSAVRAGMKQTDHAKDLT